MGRSFTKAQDRRGTVFRPCGQAGALRALPKPATATALPDLLGCCRGRNGVKSRTGEAAKRGGQLRRSTGLVHRSLCALFPSLSGLASIEERSAGPHLAHAGRRRAECAEAVARIRTQVGARATGAAARSFGDPGDLEGELGGGGRCRLSPTRGPWRSPALARLGWACGSGGSHRPRMRPRQGHEPCASKDDRVVPGVQAHDGTRRSRRACARAGHPASITRRCAPAEASSVVFPDTHRTSGRAMATPSWPRRPRRSGASAFGDDRPQRAQSGRPGPQNAPAGPEAPAGTRILVCGRADNPSETSAPSRFRPVPRLDPQARWQGEREQRPCYQCAPTATRQRRRKGIVARSVSRTPSGRTG